MPGGAANRRAGDYFERQTRATLERHMWFVIRSAGSFGPFDIVALKRGHVPILVSCKLSGKLSRADATDALEIADSLAVHAIVTDRPTAGTVRFRRLEAAEKRGPVMRIWVPYDRETIIRVSHLPPATHGSGT